MANVHVVVELEETKVLPVCLEALGQARRISTELGATLYAVVPLGHAPRQSEGDLIRVLATHGADKILLVSNEALSSAEGDIRWGTHGPALGTVMDLLPPALVLFGATWGSHEISARLAARMGAAYVTDAWIEARDAQVKIWQGAGATARVLGEVEGPVVALIPPGRYTAAHGEDDAEVEIITTNSAKERIEKIGFEADPKKSVTTEERK